MTIDLNRINVRIDAAANPEGQWWTRATEGEQDEYLQDHPHSRKKKTANDNDGGEDVKTLAAPSDFRSYQAKKQSPEMQEATSKKWNATLGMPVAEFRRTLFPDHPKARISAKVSDGKLCVLVEDAAFWARREFWRDKNGDLRVEHEHFEVKSAKQGKGLAKKMLRQQFNVYQNMGVKKVSMYANIDVGSYAWAKYGFVPDVGEWDFLKLKAKQRLQKGLRFTFNSDEDRQVATKQVTPLLASKDPKTIWELSDLTMEVNYGKDKPKKMTLGKALLMDNGWQGAFQFSDNDSIKRFNDYTRGVNK